MFDIPSINPQQAETKPSQGFTPQIQAATKLDLQHREHLISEGFTNQEIDTLVSKYGVKSLTESEARKLGFKAWDGKQWQSSSGIYFPFTEDFAQLRADIPIPRKNGKPAKYLTQKGETSQAFLPEGCLAITEGFKDALIATLRGVPTGALAGVSHYKKALPEGCKYTIVFDSDGWSNPQVFHNLIKSGLWCRGKVLILDPLPDHPKGGLCELYRFGGELDLSKAVKPFDLLLDWPNRWKGLSGIEIAKLAKKAVKLVTEYLPEDEVEAFIVRLTTQHREKGLRTRPLQKIKKKGLRKIAADEPTPYQQDYNTILSYFGNRIKLNEVSKRWELDGKPFSPDSVRNLLLLENSLKLKNPKDGLIDIIQYIAEANNYNPIQDYLNHVYEKYTDKAELLREVGSSLSERYLGTTDPLSNILLRKTLIAGIARAFKPGCKVDTSTVLVGAQGIRKSTFWKTLASPQYFCDDFSDIANKDHVLKLHNNWIIEWSELDGLRRKEVTHLKAFMATGADLIRAPYARSADYMPRPSIIVGTTNESEFLTDATGNRRWWIINCPQKIDIEAIEQDRDLIWAAVMFAYLNDEPWWLEEQQERALEVERKQYQKHDAWHDSIAEYLEDKDQVSYQEIFECVLNIEISKQDNRARGRVSKILQLEGFENAPNPVWHKYPCSSGLVKKKARVWVRKQLVVTPSTPSQGEEGPKKEALGNKAETENSVFRNSVPSKNHTEQRFQSPGTSGTEKQPTLDPQTQLKKETQTGSPNSQYYTRIGEELHLVEDCTNGDF